MQVSGSTWAHFPSAPVYFCAGALHKCASAFLVCFRFFRLTSFVHISFIRYPFYANSDSISSRIPRRTQWRNPFCLIPTFKIKYSLIRYFNVHKKYEVLHSPLLKGFRPRNLQVRKNVSYHPTSIYSKHHPRAIIVLTRF